MTDPNNIKAFSTPFPMNTITAFAVLKKVLLFGDKTGALHMYSKLTRNLKHRGTFSTPKNNYMIKTICPLPESNSILVHWTGLGGQPGPVQVIRPGGLRTTVDCQAKIVCCSPGANPYVAFINDFTIKLYKFFGPILGNPITITASGPVRCAACNAQGLMYFAKDAYHFYKFADKKEVVVQKKPSKTPAIYPLSDDSFLLASDDFQFIYSEGKEDKICHYDHESGPPSFFVGTENNLYQFYQKNFTRGPVILGEGQTAQLFPEPNVVFAALCFKELALCTRSELKIVAGMPKPDVLAARVLSDASKEQEVVTLVRGLSSHEQSETMVAIFDEVWGKNPSKALSFAKQFVWMQGVSELVALFPILTLPPECESYFQLKNAAKEPPFLPTAQKRPENDTTLLPLLKDCLEKYRADYLEETASWAINELRVTNACLAELYAQSQQIRLMDELLDEGNLDLATVIGFVDANVKALKLQPAKSLLLVYQGDTPKAVRAWMLMENTLAKKNSHNPMFVTECAYAVRRLSKDEKSLLQESLEWLYKQDPKYAIEAIMSTKHDVATIKKWLEDHQLQSESLNYYHFLVSQPSYKPTREIINQTFQLYISTLKSLESGQIDLKQYAFLLRPEEVERIQKLSRKPSEKSEKLSEKSSEKDAELNKENVSKILNANAKDLLRNHGESINAQQASEFLTPGLDPEISLLLYRVSGQYDKGLEQILADMQEFSGEIVQTVENFCQNAPQPEEAFRVLFKKVPATVVLETDIGFLERNVPYMDLKDLLAMIPKGAKVKTVQNLLKRAVGLLMEKEDSLRMQKAIAKSMLVDTDYRLAEAKSKYCKLDSVPVCAKCGKLMDNVQMKLAPNGALYHTTCYNQESHLD